MAYIKSGVFSLKTPADVNQRNALRVGLIDSQLISHLLDQLWYAPAPSLRCDLLK